MQTNGCAQHNGTTDLHENGSSTQSTSNGAVTTNGSTQEQSGRNLSKIDQDIVRLIGQHLRGLGFK